MRLAPLVALQKIDSRIHVLRREREAIPGRLHASEDRVARAKTSVDEFQALLKRQKVEIDRKTLDLKASEAKITQLDGQLNQAKTNKEYALLKKEIDGHKADNGMLEDEILRLYTALEEKEKEGRSFGDALRQAEAAFAGEKGKADAEIAAIDAEIASLEKERAGVAAGIDGDLLKGYQRILRGKPDGLAIARVVHVRVPGEKNGEYVCQGCDMFLTPQEVNLLLADKDVHSCKRCCRLIYIEKEPKPAAAAPKA